MRRGSGRPSPGVSVRWPLVGRDADLHRLDTGIGDGWLQGALLHGSAGVGKSRLADELLDRRGRGRPGLRVTASAATAAVPLATLAPLLPSEAFDRSYDPVTLLERTTRRLRRGDGPSGRGSGEDGPSGRGSGEAESFMLVVDDAHHLDVTSLSLIGQLLDRRSVTLVATVRSGEETVPALTDLGRREHVEHLELTELSRADSEALLTAVLGGPVEAATVDALWSRTQGNVLFLRELTTEATTSGVLSPERGQWRLRGPLPTPRRLSELIRARLAALGDEAREGVELIAAWEPAGLADVETAIGARTLESLDRAGLLDVREDQRRRLVALAHPLYGETIRDELPTLTRRRLRAARAAAITARGGRRRGDPIEIVTASLDGDAPVDAGLVLHAGHLACYGHDYEQCVRLARVALAAEVTPGAALLLAEGLIELGRASEVEEVLATHHDLFAGAPDDVALTAYNLRVGNLVVNLQRPDDAVTVQRTARERFGADHPEILLTEASIALFTGGPRTTLALAARVDESDIVTRTRWASMKANALCVTGACDQALAVSQRAFAEHSELVDWVNKSHPGVHVIHQVMALTDAGRLAEADELAEIAHGVALGGGPPWGRVWFGAQLGRIAALQGRPRRARRFLVEATGVATEYGLMGARRLTLSLLAMVEAWLDDADAAADCVAELEALEPYAYLEAEQQLGPAWAAVAAGDFERGRRILRDAAERALAAGFVTSAAWALHDLARLGDPVTARDRLAEVTPRCEGRLVPAYAAHALALCGRRGDALAACSERFEHLGATLLAAEAAVSGADAYRRDGERREASALATRTAGLVERCEGARTPGLVTIEAHEPLSAREREIAVLAASRLPAREIAERLHLSVRTVNNHLQRVYTKLGVSGRAELADALGS